MSSNVRSRHEIVLVFMLLSVSCHLVQCQALLKEPNTDMIMISEHSPGIRLTCYFNQSESSNDKELGDNDKSMRDIQWILENSQGSETVIDGDHVTESEDGKWILHIDEQNATESIIKCRAEDGSSQAWRVVPLFKLEKVEHSRTVVHGDDIILQCKLRENSASNGDIKFSWYKVPEGDPESQGEGPLKTTSIPRDEIDPHIKVVNNVEKMKSSLKIYDAEYEDRAYYRCIAQLSLSSEFGDLSLNSTSQQLLRVKDQYAALYPFIGIVLEVVVLAVIIIIYEKRKSAEDGGDDDDDDDDSHAKTSSENNQSNVRQRRR